MKRTLAIFLTLITVLSSLMLSSCSNPPELEEIKGDIEKLLTDSREINMILFGEGLPIAMQTTDGVEAPVPTDFENYYYVDPDTGFFMVDQIKKEAEKVFSKDYIEPLYENFFTGHYDAVYGGVVRAIYIDSDNGLLKLKDYEPFLKGEMRTYDFSTVKIVRPSRKDYVNFTIDSYRNGEKMNIHLSMVKTEDGWRLDSPSY